MNIMRMASRRGQSQFDYKDIENVDLKYPKTKLESLLKSEGQFSNVNWGKMVKNYLKIGQNE